MGLLILIVFIYVAFRTKDFFIGLFTSILTSVGVLFLIAIVAPIFGLLGLIILCSQYISEEAQFYIGLLSSMIGCLALILVFSTPVRRLKMAGNFVTNGQIKSAQLAQGAVAFLFGYCQITVLIDGLNRNADEAYRRNIFWWIVLICLALYSFYSFENREKGFVHHGRIILFSNIEHAEWADKSNKIKLKVRLKNAKQETTLKIPLELSGSIDNYVGRNFPNP
jgi:hypothetical protein